MSAFLVLYIVPFSFCPCRRWILMRSCGWLKPEKVTRDQVPQMSFSLSSRYLEFEPTLSLLFTILLGIPLATILTKDKILFPVSDSTCVSPSRWPTSPTWRRVPQRWWSGGCLTGTTSSRRTSGGGWRRSRSRRRWRTSTCCLEAGAPIRGYAGENTHLTLDFLSMTEMWLLHGAAQVAVCEGASPGNVCAAELFTSILSCSLSGDWGSDGVVMRCLLPHGVGESLVIPLCVYVNLLHEKLP